MAVPTESRITLSGAGHVSLTNSPIDILSTMALVRDPSAGAIVSFAGTTRSTFDSQPVARLSYVAYTALALSTMERIAQKVHADHGLVKIAMVHRLGEVPVEEESVLICVSAPHRKAAWKAGEEALELVKEKVEIWKREEFVGEKPDEGKWRANKDIKMEM